MPREKKAQIIDRLQEAFSKCSVGILTDYRGMPTFEMNNLRHTLRESGIKYKVVKNTLAQFAAQREGKGNLTSSFDGPIAIAFGYGEIAEPARILADYIRASNSALSIKGGFIGDRLLRLEEVMTLSTIPSKEVLLAKVIGGMQSPISALIGCLNSPIMGIMEVLQARIQQLEGE